MAHTVLHKITNICNNKYYSIIVDVATDMSFKEQVNICIAMYLLIWIYMKTFKDFLKQIVPLQRF